jgi:hypothetical protein
MQALADVLGAQLRADHAFLDEFHRRRQRAGAQQQGQLGWQQRAAMPVIWKFEPNSLWMVATDSTVYLPFSFSRSPCACRRFAGHGAHLAAAVAVQVEADGRLLVLVEAGGGAG